MAPQLSPWRQLQGPQRRVGGRGGDRPLVPQRAQPRPAAGEAALGWEEWDVKNQMLTCLKCKPELTWLWSQRQCLFLRLTEKNVLEIIFLMVSNYLVRWQVISLCFIMLLVENIKVEKLVRGPE